MPTTVPPIPDKVDSSIKYVIEIPSETDCIGNTLSTINMAFTALDTGLANVEFSAINLWTPVYETVSQLSGTWIEMKNIVTNLSADWVSTHSTVQSTSAFWSTPITVVWPQIQNYATSTAGIETLARSASAYVASTFPVTAGGGVQYKNGQELYLYSLEGFTKTREYSERIVPPCTITYRLRLLIWTGGARLGPWRNNKKKNKKFVKSRGVSGVRASCGAGRSTCNSEPCETRINYQDSYIRRITGHRLEVEDCQWVYKGYIPPGLDEPTLPFTLA